VHRYSAFTSTLQTTVARRSLVTLGDPVSWSNRGRRKTVKLWQGKRGKRALKV
jgi:hypothetical protein